MNKLFNDNIHKTIELVKTAIKIIRYSYISETKEYKNN